MFQNKRDNFKKIDISKIINSKLGISVNYTNKIIDDLIYIVSNQLKTKKKLNIKNFGTFKVLSKKKRIGRNPKTLEKFEISERKTISFKSSKNLEINE